MTRSTIGNSRRFECVARVDARDDDVDAPTGLHGGEVEVAGERFVVLSYPREAGAPWDTLTEAEAVVALLVLRGLSNRDIAFVRGTSTRTVANQLASIFAKLGVGSRVELTARLVDGAGLA